MSSSLAYSTSSAGQPLYYRHSGAFDPLGALGALLLGVLAGLALAPLYAFLDIQSPVIQLNLLLAGGFGAGIGAAVAFPLWKTRARNVPVAVGVALLAALPGYYLCWASWMAQVFASAGARESPGTLTLAVNPFLMLTAARTVNGAGTFAMHSGESPVTGGPLLVCWIAEASMILGAAVAIPWVMLRSAVHCDRCSRWCARSQNVMVAEWSEPKALKGRLEAHDFSALRVKATRSDRLLSVDLHVCSGCQATYAVTIKTLTGSGRSRRTRKVVDRLLISKEELGGMTGRV